MTLDQVKAKLADIKGARLVRAEQAIAAGLAIITVPATGKRAVVVGSKSGHGSYVVTGTGCTCQGWTRRGWCCHADAVYLMLVARAAHKAEAAAAAPADGDELDYVNDGTGGAGAPDWNHRHLPRRDGEQPDAAYGEWAAAVDADTPEPTDPAACLDCGRPIVADADPLCSGCRAVVDLYGAQAVA